MTILTKLVIGHMTRTNVLVFTQGNEDLRTCTKSHTETGGREPQGGGLKL